jgi:hypothetical protein
MTALRRASRARAHARAQQCRLRLQPSATRPPNHMICFARARPHAGHVAPTAGLPAVPLVNTQRHRASAGPSALFVFTPLKLSCGGTNWRYVANATFDAVTSCPAGCARASYLMVGCGWPSSLGRTGRGGISRIFTLAAIPSAPLCSAWNPRLQGQYAG